MWIYELLKKYFRLATAAGSNEETTNKFSQVMKCKETQTAEENTREMH